MLDSASPRFFERAGDSFSQLQAGYFFTQLSPDFHLARSRGAYNSPCPIKAISSKQLGRLKCWAGECSE